MALLKDILSSQVRAEIFRLLFGVSDQEVHLRELERRSGLAVRTVHQELKKLTGLDLLKTRRDGNRLYYRANRNHPLYPEIHNLVIKTSGLVDVLRNALQHLNVQLAFVFGSVARNEESGSSDIDLMVIGKVKLRELTKALTGVFEVLRREVNPVPMTAEEFKRRKKMREHFIRQVLRGPRIFVIGDENELKGLGK